MKLPEGLVFSSDEEAGFTRKGAGKGFAFYDADGKLVTDAEVRKRLNGMAIPPAYEDVWYCADLNGHLQATGIDSKGRKQYRYHERWTEWREAEKFAGLIDFAAVLPKVRRRVARGLVGDRLDKERVLCAVVRLLDKTAARIGNEIYYEENGSVGLTTLRDEHVDLEDGHVLLEYVAKGGKERKFDVFQPKLAEVVGALSDLPGQRLFRYRGVDGELHPVDSGDVNAWLKEVSGEEISAKDFRTWHASVLCLDEFLGEDDPGDERGRVSLEVEVLKRVSAELGHRPPVCKKHYVHPEILRLQRAGEIWEFCERLEGAGSELRVAEGVFLGFLERLG